MQVGSARSLQAQLQSLENAALGQYQGGQPFSFALDQATQAAGGSTGASDSTGSTGTSPAGLSGRFSGGYLYAVGTMGPDGQMVPYSAQQVQSEIAAAQNVQKTAYGDSLQNFLALAQAADPAGQIGAASYSDQQNFVGDNGNISVQTDTSFALKP